MNREAQRKIKKYILKELCSEYTPPPKVGSKKHGRSIMSISEQIFAYALLCKIKYSGDCNKTWAGIIKYGPVY